MNTRTRDTTARRMALALGGALTLASAGPAAAGTVQFTACPYTIPAPGTYVLAADFACGGGITVQADDVQLVLGKHTITGPGIGFGGDGVVAPSHKGLRVVGGTITGFERGIDIQATSGARVSGTTASGNRVGIFLANCAGCQVTDSRASGGIVGIDIVGSSPNTRAADNTATGNGTFGIVVDSGTTGVRLTGNVATGNGGLGGSDLYDNNLPGACVNTWRDNTFDTDNEGDGPGAGCIR